MPKNSIFQLRKVKPLDPSKPQIRTVNFENEEITDPNIKAYFNSRIRFLAASYDFAKEAKLNEDFDFIDNAETKEKIKLWLEQNQKASMTDSTEFGVITTKVVESIKSVQKNPYLKKLRDDLKILIWKKNNKSETEKKDLINFHISLDDIQSLEEKEIKTIFNYELISKAETIGHILSEIDSKEVLKDSITTAFNYLKDFQNKAFEAWNKAFSDLKSKLESQTVKDLSEIFILKLYFSFDGNIRKIENDLLPGINSELNFIKQNFAQSLLESDTFVDFEEATI